MATKVAAVTCLNTHESIKRAILILVCVCETIKLANKLHFNTSICFTNTWVKVFRIIPEFRILRLTFHRKSASKY